MARLQGDSPVRDSFGMVAGIVVYVEKWVEIYGTPIFKLRLEKGYYDPSRIPTLTEIDKLPQVFDDERITPVQKQALAQYINTLIDERVEDYVYLFKTTSRIPVTSKPEKFIVRIDTHKKKCKDYPEEDIITYKGKCYSIKELFKNAELFGEMVDPETGEEFDPEFVARLETYTSPSKEETPIIQEDEKDELAPDLIAKILEDIDNMENDLVDSKVASGSVRDEKGEPLTREDACHYCSNVIDDPSVAYKTILSTKSGHKMVEFCSSKCVSKQKF